ncbi:hypothetical protein ScPMuIL_000691 [Solemya velum]
MEGEDADEVMHMVSLPQEHRKDIKSTIKCSEDKNEIFPNSQELTQDPNELEVEIIPPTPTESNKQMESKELNIIDTDYSEENILPRVNCTEKIIICLDLSSEMDKPIFRARAGDKFSPLQLIKRALSFFVQSKHKLDRDHQFALVLLHETALWMLDFTNDPKEITNWLDDLNNTFECEKFDVSSLYELILKKIDLPHVEGDQTICPPPFTVRALMIYGRSHCAMEFTKLDDFKILDSSPYFFLDVFYIHEMPAEDNKCEEIYNSICDLDTKGQSYIFEASKNPTKLYDYMAQLLAHPLQRPLQNDSTYRIQQGGTGED